MLTISGFDLPRDRWRNRGTSRLVGAWKSKGYRSHDAITDEQMDDLWELGEDIANECAGFGRLGEADPEKCCVVCDNLPGCNGERTDIRPDLLRMLKTAFRHDLYLEE